MAQAKQVIADKPRASRWPRSAVSPRVRVALVFPAQGRTKQEFKAECDINNIMARYLRTGVIEFRNKYEPRYADVSGLDFNTAMEVVSKASSMFEELPAKLRERFENDPAKFLDFVGDEGNREEAKALGLIRSGVGDASGSSPMPPPSSSSSSPQGASNSNVEGSAKEPKK